MTYRLSLDSSIIISHLSGDVHAPEVLPVMERLATQTATLFFSLVGYAEVQTGIELLRNVEQREQAAHAVQSTIQARGIMLVADNVVIARDAARAQAEYRQHGGCREAVLPDFLIGANAVHYSGRLLTTNPRDFLRYFPTLEVLTPSALLERQ